MDNSTLRKNKNIKKLCWLPRSTSSSFFKIVHPFHASTKKNYIYREHIIERLQNPLKKTGLKFVPSTNPFIQSAAWRWVWGRSETQDEKDFLNTIKRSALPSIFYRQCLPHAELMIALSLGNINRVKIRQCALSLEKLHMLEDRQFNWSESIMIKQRWIGFWVSQITSFH